MSLLKRSLMVSFAVVFVLSAVFLHERVDVVSVLGIALTIGGVALLSLRG